MDPLDRSRVSVCVCLRCTVGICVRARANVCVCYKLAPLEGRLSIFEYFPTHWPPPPPPLTTPVCCRGATAAAYSRIKNRKSTHKSSFVVRYHPDSSMENGITFIFHRFRII
uniref:Uncharacterized protein n=1 Tax=Schizaphis graminum TaxID=13262 RepID=A0A2S2P3N8_SCHGA